MVQSSFLLLLLLLVGLVVLAIPLLVGVVVPDSDRSLLVSEADCEYVMDSELACWSGGGGEDEFLLLKVSDDDDDDDLDSTMTG